VWFRWSRPLTGFYGQGIAEELLDVQVRLNQLNRFIQKCQDLIAVPRVFVDVASKTLKVQLDNKVGAIIPYRGKPPTFFTPQALSAEIYNERDRLVRDAFNRIGVSQLSAQSLKPAGLESAVALREFNDIEGQRFAIQAQRYEQWFKDLARKIIECGRDLYKRGKAPKTVYASRNLVEHIDWADVDMEEDRYALDIEAASILSMSPAARLQAVTELAQVGAIQQPEVRKLLRHPDLEHSDNIAYADFEDIEAVIEMLLDGKYEPPEPFQNLELGIRRCQLAMLKAKREGAPEDILENFRTWVSQAERELTMSQAPPAGAPPMPEEAAMLQQEAQAGPLGAGPPMQGPPGMMPGM
jgi:hypothetical protein